MADHYGIQRKLFRVHLHPTSDLLGQTLADAVMPRKFGVSVTGVLRHDKPVGTQASLPISNEDDLVIIASEEEIAHLAQKAQADYQPINEENIEALASEFGLTEILLPDESPWVGHSLHELALPTQMGLHVYGIAHGRERINDSQELLQHTMHCGDRLLIGGSWQNILELRKHTGTAVLLHLPIEHQFYAPTSRKAPIAIAALVVMALLMATGWVENATAVLIAVLMVVLGGCVAIDRAYRSIDLKSIVLIACMMPLALAPGSKRRTEAIVNIMMASLGGFGSHVMLAGVFLFTALLGLFISNTASAALAAPIALQAAQDMGVAMEPFAMAVCLASSAAFLTPVSSPVNTIVVEPGGYSFSDFTKFPPPPLLWVALVTVIVVPIWPFAP